MTKLEFEVFKTALEEAGHDIIVDEWDCGSSLDACIEDRTSQNEFWFKNGKLITIDNFKENF